MSLSLNTAARRSLLTCLNRTWQSTHLMLSPGLSTLPNTLDSSPDAEEAWDLLLINDTVGDGASCSSASAYSS